MPKEDNNIFHERDILCDYFKDNLEDLQLPVDKRCWKNINQKLNAKKRLIVLKRSISGVAAAVLISIIICGVSGVFSDKPTATLAVITHNDKISKISLTPVAESAPTKSFSEKKLRIKSNASESDSSYACQSFDQIEPAEQAESFKSEDITDNQYTRPILKNDTINNSIKNNLIAFDTENEEKENNRYGLSASFSTAGSSAGNRRGRYSISSDKTHPSHNTAHDKKFSTPFSIGMIFSKGISRRTLLETGVVYNFLSTSFNIQDNNSSCTLKLHYIGIPLNATTEICKISPHCRIYITAGIMAEKGIVSILTKENQMTGISVTKSHKIDGIQWSINSAAGISCNIFSNWSLYFEPHLSHYFENNQPLSIRTVKHTIASINTGLRYEF